MAEMSCALRRHLAWIVAALLLSCGPASPPARAVPEAETPPPQSGGNVALEAEVFELVNRHRQALGLRALELNERLGRAARLHSAAMAAGRVPLGHDGFRARFDATGLDCQRSAENVAFNERRPRPGSEVVDGWLRSRAHRNSIEGLYEVTGVGVASNADGAVYFTQVFLGNCVPRATR
jgi:uncharacterized protein YkwD